LETGDLEIGAVEIKNATDDTRAIVGLNGLHVDVRNIEAGTNIIGKVGIDQTTDGTTNKVQARNSTHDNFNANVNLQVNDVDVSSTNAVPEYVPAYMVSATPITRSSTTTAYAAGQLLLGNGETTLPYIDFSTALGFSVANRKIAITSCYVFSSNGANAAWNGFIDIFNVNNPVCATPTVDYYTFSPTAATLVSNFVNTIDTLSNSRKYGTSSALIFQTELTRKCQLDSSGRLYLAPICTSAYTPISGEVFTIMVKFYLLN
jgi:hypothetical protein